ncbi:MAG: biopolymer transport protein ExbD [Desulfobacteraceae bacterium Eth-SRB1]|nr:MAG: biopolymer transport protein ExbD [Desulfobacteraceae bacterium Eth-SRB1]
MKLSPQTNRKARIEMLPLIDIVFLVLVFFIYAMLSMAVHRGLPVILPSSSTAKIDKTTVLSVTVKTDGTVFIDKKPTTLDGLTEDLKRAIKEDDGAGVLLFADRDLSYQKLFKVMDCIRTVGITKISLQAEADN